MEVCQQGIKEVTFIKMGMRGRPAETRGEALRCRGTEMRNEWSHIHMRWIKIGRDNSGERDLSNTPDHPAQGSSARR